MTEPTKAQLKAALAAEKQRSHQIALALKLLACHARDANDNLPPMHAADLQHITKTLATI